MLGKGDGTTNATFDYLICTKKKLAQEIEKQISDVAISTEVYNIWTRNLGHFQKPYRLQMPLREARNLNLQELWVLTDVMQAKILGSWNQKQFN